MHQSEHAQQIAARFKSLVEQAGDTLKDEHFDELVLLVEAGLDTALVDMMEKVSQKLSKMSHDILNDAEFFN